MTPPFVLQYDMARYPLAQLVADMLACGDLRDLHRAYTLPDHPVAPVEDQRTVAHAAFYGQLGSRPGQELLALCHDLAAQVAWHLGDSDDGYVVQAVPTFRVQGPGGVAVGEFHVDADYGHIPGGTTVWIPLTMLHPSTAVWIESAPGVGDCSPILTHPGHLLALDTARLRHGNHANTTGYTRVSLDLRVVPFPLYAAAQTAADVCTRARGVPMRIGHYYTLLRGGPQGVTATGTAVGRTVP